MMARSVLSRPQDEGAGGPLQPLSRALVPFGLDGYEVVPFELTLRSQQARVQELHHRPQVAHMVLHGRAGQSHPIIGAQRPGGSGLPGGRVLDVLGLVQHDAPPRHLSHEPDVPRQHPVAGHDDGVLLSRRNEFGVPPAARTVMHHQRQVGREPGGLLAPVVEHRGRTDQQRRSLDALPAVLLDGGQGLDRFAQAHVVGQAGAQAPAPQERQPGIAPLLVGTQRPAEPFRGFPVPGTRPVR